MALNNRYDFVMLLMWKMVIQRNGDPDAGNSPRVDVESGYGYITDVCLKRKIRNCVELLKEDEPGYNILIKPDKSLNVKFAEAYDASGLNVIVKERMLMKLRLLVIICAKIILMYELLAQ